MGNLVKRSIQKSTGTGQVVFDNELREHVTLEKGGTNFYIGPTEWALEMAQRAFDEFDPKKNTIFQVDVMFEQTGSIKRIRILFGCPLSNKSYEMISRPKQLQLVLQDRKEYEVELKEFGTHEEMKALFFK